VRLRTSDRHAGAYSIKNRQDVRKRWILLAPTKPWCPLVFPGFTTFTGAMNKKSQ
jgi:hypothetical protein